MAKRPSCVLHSLAEFASLASSELSARPAHTEPSFAFDMAWQTDTPRGGEHVNFARLRLCLSVENSPR